jgi:hypothetical protein
MDTEMRWMDDLGRTSQLHRVRKDNPVVEPHLTHFMQVPYERKAVG